jgi:hypothetical protein
MDLRIAALYWLDVAIPVSLGVGRRLLRLPVFGTIRGNANLFYTWAAIPGPYAADMIYDRTESYTIVLPWSKSR